MKSWDRRYLDFVFGWYEKIERQKTFYLAKSNIKGGMRGHMGNFLSNLLPLPLPPPTTIFSPIRGDNHFTPNDGFLKKTPDHD